VPGPERFAQGYLSCELWIAVRGIAVPFLKNGLIEFDEVRFWDLPIFRVKQIMKAVVFFAVRVLQR
jgi:hypothetical protein